MICNNNYLADILRVCEIKDLIWVMRFQSPLVYIEDVHLLFCAHLIYIFSFFTGVELRHFFPSEMRTGCLVCVICNSNSFHSFIFKLCIMIVRTLKMCTSFFVFNICFVCSKEPSYCYTLLTKDLTIELKAVINVLLFYKLMSFMTLLELFLIIVGGFYSKLW